jgi:hypothetical protein
MTDTELLELSTHLKQQADQIVENLNLLKIANKYAECHQIGSSVMDLMVDEDIDFICYVEQRVDIDKCFAFAKELVTTGSIEVLKIKNYLEKAPYYQFKVYIEPYKYNNREWKIAFSFYPKTPERYDTDVNRIERTLQQLTPEIKLSILKLKIETRKNNLKVSGRKIYDAVFDHKISSYDQLTEYLKK